MPDVALTWLGHAAFRFDSAGRQARLRRPVPPGEPEVPRGRAEPERVDLILVTHGHDDHVGDTVELAKRFECPVIAQVELRGWLVGARVSRRTRRRPATRAGRSSGAG